MKRTALCSPIASSFETSSVRASTLLPVYTASSVSKSLPAVSIVTAPPSGAVQLHHSDAPPPSPAWSGSPGSLAAPALLPVARPDAPPIPGAESKLSLPAATATVHIPMGRSQLRGPQVVGYSRPSTQVIAAPQTRDGSQAMTGSPAWLQLSTTAPVAPP